MRVHGDALLFLRTSLGSMVAVEVRVRASGAPSARWFSSFSAEWILSTLSPIMLKVTRLESIFETEKEPFYIILHCQMSYFQKTEEFEHIGLTKWNGFGSELVATSIGAVITSKRLSPRCNHQAQSIRKWKEYRKNLGKIDGCGRCAEQKELYLIHNDGPDNFMWQNDFIIFGVVGLFQSLNFRTKWFANRGLLSIVCISINALLCKGASSLNKFNNIIACGLSVTKIRY